jgi:raffinose/stachyose/melibiose transport system substrate-binding protein
MIRLRALNISVLRNRFLAAALAMAPYCLSSASANPLVIDSWRFDDAEVWRDVLIPAFQKLNPKITLTFRPSSPRDYGSDLEQRLQSGGAGDLIFCRPYDQSADLHLKGRLAPLGELAGLKNFSTSARSAWSTDGGYSTYCLPIAFVAHGFLYNKDALEKIGASEPRTREEFRAVLEKLKADGTYIPLALGTAEQWEAAIMGLQNIGPTDWRGEDGRLSVIAGAQKLSDAPYVNALRELQTWRPYLPPNFQNITYRDARDLFIAGKAAIYPAVSWDLAPIRAQSKIRLGAFKPPRLKDDQDCFVTMQPDIGIGINAATANKTEARAFLDFAASKEFAELLANNVPGLFPMTDEPTNLTDDIARAFVSWRDVCKTTIRLSSQTLNRGTPQLENELWRVSAQVLDGAMTPEDAAKQLQDGLAQWYPPQKSAQ